MLFLLDTNAFSDMMNGQPQVAAHIAAISAPDQVAICSITWGEIRFGIDRLPDGKRRRELHANAASLFAVVACVPVPAAAGEEYSRLKLARQRLGTPMDENDLWIAATAFALGAVLVTRDADFQAIAGLTVEDWTH